MDIYKDNKMHTCPKCAVILPHNIFLLFYKKSPDIFMPLHSLHFSAWEDYRQQCEQAGGTDYIA